MFFNARLRKIGKAWSIMWCNDDVWTLFGTWFEISTHSPTHSFTAHECCHCVCSYWQSNDGTAHSGYRKNSSINPSYNRCTSAAVIFNVTLWTAYPLCHGQVTLLRVSIRTKRPGTLQCNNDCWTRCACCRTGVIQSYFFSTCSLCCYCHSIVHNIHAVQSARVSRWRFQTASQIVYTCHHYIT